MSSFPSNLLWLCVCVCVWTCTNLFLNRKIPAFFMIVFSHFLPPAHQLEAAFLFLCYFFSPTLLWNYKGINELFRIYQVLLFYLNACFLETRKTKDKFFEDSRSALEMHHFSEKLKLNEFSQWFWSNSNTKKNIKWKYFTTIKMCRWGDLVNIQCWNEDREGAYEACVKSYL